jgi:hypothetical protein
VGVFLLAFLSRPEQASFHLRGQSVSETKILPSLFPSDQPVAEEAQLKAS